MDLSAVIQWAVVVAVITFAPVWGPHVWRLMFTEITIGRNRDKPDL